jgi:NACHT domain
VTDPFEHKNHLKRKKGDRTQGTCEWILATEELTTWLEAGPAAGPDRRATDILWLWGYPGTGKSTMSIFLAEELSKIFSTATGRTLAYFFCDSSFEEQRTATAILRGLLLQLLQQHPQLLSYVLPKYNERGAKLFESFDALWTIFTSMAADKATGRKYCIIDALDECDLESQETLLRQLRQTFEHPNSDLSSSIRILMTSRPYEEIRRYLGRPPFLSKDLASFQESRRDIESFITKRVASLRDINDYPDSVAKQVTRLLEDGAKGTFLWVGLACTELEKVDSKDAVSFLQELPHGLQSLYKTLLDKALISDKARKDVIKRILSFVAVSIQPLSLPKLSTACQLHQDQGEKKRNQFMREEIASYRLIVIIQDDKVLLLHQSVKDFLVGSSAGHFINEFEAHATIAHRYVHQLI